MLCKIGPRSDHHRPGPSNSHVGWPRSPSRGEQVHQRQLSPFLAPIGAWQARPVYLNPQDSSRRRAVAKSPSEMASAISSTPSMSSSPAQHFPAGRRPSRAVPPTAPILTHEAALESIRGFLRERSSYDVFPVSFRLIVLDHQLVVKKALEAMILNGEDQVQAMELFDRNQVSSLRRCGTRTHPSLQECSPCRT